MKWGVTLHYVCVCAALSHSDKKTWLDHVGTQKMAAFADEYEACPEVTSWFCFLQSKETARLILTTAVPTKQLLGTN